MTLSTHVLDTGRGVPAAGVPIRVDRSDGDGWTAVAAGTTDSDGRAGGWTTGQPGIYRLVFDLSAGSTVDGPFFPEVTVVFRIADAGGRMHVPLLLGPYGYTTYRGS